MGTWVSSIRYLAIVQWIRQPRPGASVTAAHATTDTMRAYTPVWRVAYSPSQPRPATPNRSIRSALTWPHVIRPGQAKKWTESTIMIVIHWFDFVILFFIVFVILAVLGAIVFYLVASGREKWRNSDGSARR